VFSLENRKFQLQLSMEERKHEVEVHRELLQAGGVVENDYSTDIESAKYRILLAAICEVEIECPHDGMGGRGPPQTESARMYEHYPSCTSYQQCEYYSLYLD